MKINPLLWMGLVFGLILPSKAQSKKEADLDALILSLFSQPKEENQISDYDALYESLYQLYLQPIDLNKAKRTDLEFLFILSELQINSFLAYREKYGKLLSIYELQTIPEFDMRTIEKIRPFVEVAEAGNNIDGRSIFKRIAEEKDNHYLMVRSSQTLEPKKGYSPADTNSKGQYNARYLGSPQQLYIRYRLMHAGDFSFGFTLKKDAGEPFLWDQPKQQYGFDFFSFHAMLENKGPFKKIILGDYQLGFGQNLVFGAGFSLGKGGETVITTRRTNPGIRPFTSSMETSFLRGLAFTLSLKPLDITLFYSGTFKDARVLNPLQNDTLSQADQPRLEAFIENFQATGLHRTSAEREAKNTISEQLYGVNFLYKNKDERLQLGSTFVYQHFGIPLIRQDKIYNRFEFSGQENWTGSVYSSFHWQNMQFFAEAALGKGGGKAWVGGLIASLSSKVDFTFLYRNYDRDFHSFYGNAFGENSRNINERGFYWGIKIKPFKKVEMAAYYDHFNFPYLKFFADAPSEGFEYLAKLTYILNKKINMFFQYRNESKEFNNRDSKANMHVLEYRNIGNYLFNLEFHSSHLLSMKTRIQYNTQQQGKDLSEGYLIFQDIGFDFKKISFDLRFALFDDNTHRYAENNDGATYLYVYEKNVLWAPTLARYSGRGSHYMLLLHYKASQHLDLWLRFTQTQRNDTKTIGTGLEQIPGNTESLINFQVKYGF